ncbi:crosslink repair DNA glycosylase YcaQ family protein [Streptomyces sp. CT34]|uniref:DNA glycosylase AlkZ-like family protein n=1 Tax=Streptomyces sp. CT34 TaxID=1553907 RepID=UPI00068D1BA8|nr:crosslink repair DNA glycosylase YcaQ family protein [Streptomyces sp. CT34]
MRRALAARALVKTWAMRGTLHLLPAGGTAAYLSLLGAARTREKPSWQRAFGVAPQQMEMLGEAVDELLDGRLLTRQELTAALLERPGKGVAVIGGGAPDGARGRRHGCAGAARRGTVGDGAVLPMPRRGRRRRHCQTLVQDSEP